MRYLLIPLMAILIGACAAPGSLMKLRHPNGTRYALQLDFPNGEECRVFVAHQMQAIRKLNPDWARTPHFLECTSASIDETFPYAGFVQVPGIDKPVPIYAKTRLLCEHAAAVLYMQQMPSSGCKRREFVALSSNNMLQIRAEPAGTVLAEMVFRTQEDCFDVARWRPRFFNKADEQYGYWCIPEAPRNKDLQLELRVLRKPDRFNDGEMTMYLRSEALCPEFESGLVFDAMQLNIIRGCKPKAESL